MRALLYFLLLAATRASELSAPSAPSELSELSDVSDACPAGCVCGEGDGEREYTCRAGDAEYMVKALPNDYARIICLSGDLNPASMPPLPLSRSGTLASVGLRACTLPSTLASVLARVGARGARSVALVAPRGALGAAFVKGVEMVDMLLVTDAAQVREIPWALADALPALAQLQIRDANITLDGMTDEEAAAVTPHPSLRLLELTLSNVTSLPRHAFARARNIQRLHLFGNEIAELNSEAFLGLDQVEDLDLSRNPLTVLPGHVFSALPRLRRLTLVATKLTEVHSDAFAGLVLLEQVVLKFNQARVQFGSRALSSLPALAAVTVDRCRLAPLPADLLQGSQALQELNITGSNLVSIPEGLLHDQQQLRRLDLRGNRLRMIPRDALWSLAALEELNLDDNRIGELPGQLFSGLRRLRRFTAERNAMSHVAPDALRGAAALEYVSLADNNLTLDETVSPYPTYLDIDAPSPFSQLPQLLTLKLRRNRVARVFPDWRLRLLRLALLDLRENDFTELTRADFQFLGANMTIDLRHNRIAHVDLTEPIPGLPPQGDNGNVMLLDNNPFSCDCDLFTFIQRLEGAKPAVAEPRLDPGEARCASPPALAAAPLRTLPSAALTCPLRDEHCPTNCSCFIRPSSLALELDCDEAPKEFTNPENFGLIQTHLRLRQLTSLVLPAHVTVVNLTNAGITKPPSLEQLKNVKELDLSSNEMTSAPINLLASNLTLHLSGNPLVCDCAHLEDVSGLQKWVSKVADADKVMCSAGESLWNVDAGRLCDVRHAALLGGTLAAIGIIAAVIAALAYRYTLEIKLFFFSRGWLKSLIHEDEIDKGAVYDAFVSFSQEDAKWVTEKLVPVLEGEHKFKLCVHYRDWVVGDMIPAQIARSVEQSRRTIIVLSRSFLKSTWASLEFRAAHVRDQREGRARVLVLVLEDILENDEIEMDAELRAYLTTNTYLKWGDPWFWEKLRYAMPHRRSGLNDVYVNGVDKLKKGLNAKLTCDGKIVNDGSLASLNVY